MSAIELLCSCQALEFQRPLKGSRSIELVHQAVRKKVNVLEEDRYLADDIKSILDLISKEELTLLVEERIGELK